MDVRRVNPLIGQNLPQAGETNLTIQRVRPVPVPALDLSVLHVCAPPLELPTPLGSLFDCGLLPKLANRKSCFGPFASRLSVRHSSEGPDREFILHPYCRMNAAAYQPPRPFSQLTRTTKGGRCLEIGVIEQRVPSVYRKRRAMQKIGQKRFVL